MTVPRGPILLLRTRRIWSSGSTLYADLGAFGIWRHDGASWSKLAPENPEQIVVSGSNLYADLGSLGIWKYNGTSWSFLAPENPENLVASGSTLYADLGAYGIWKHDGTAWSFLAPENPEQIVTSGLDLFADLGPYGIWKHDGTAWSFLAPENPEGLVGSTAQFLSPANVQAEPGNGSNTISWEEVGGATFYNVYWSTSPAVTKLSGTKIAGVTDCSYKHNGLTNGVTYYYVVAAANSLEESAISDEASGQPAAEAQVSRITRMSVYKGELLHEYLTYEYNEAGKVSKQSGFDFADNLKQFTTYEYNESGNETKRSNYVLGNQLIGFILTEYNDAQKPTRILTYSHYSGTDILTLYVGNEYDTDGNRTRVITYNGMTNLIMQYSVFEYNSAGKVTKESTFDFDDNPTGHITYEYDEANNEIRKSRYTAAGLDTYVTSEYNEKGKITKQTTRNGMTNLVTEYTTYEYNAGGKLTRTSNFDFAGNPTAYSIMEYNAEGKRTAVKVYDETGIIKAMTIWEYGY